MPSQMPPYHSWCHQRPLTTNCTYGHFWNDDYNKNNIKKNNNVNNSKNTEKYNNNNNNNYKKAKTYDSLNYNDPWYNNDNTFNRDQLTHHNNNEDIYKNKDRYIGYNMHRDIRTMGMNAREKKKQLSALERRRLWLQRPKYVLYRGKKDCV